MIIKPSDIVFYVAKLNNPLGEYLKAHVHMHKPTGVVFQHEQNDENTSLRFKVYEFDHNGKPENAKEFDSSSEKSFFEAVDYFEKLISERQPPKKTPPPSMGVFVYARKSSGVILIHGVNPVVVKQEDLPKVFTPPVNKPYGRLDMTVVDRPEYESVKSKFALSFNEELTKKYADSNDLKIEDVAVYDMTPYSNNSQESQGEPEPDQMNSDSLTLDQIEGESAENMKGSSQEKPKTTDQEKQKQQNKKREKQKESQEKSQKEDDKEQEPQEPQPEPAVQPHVEPENLSIIETLNKLFGADIKQTFRKQERFLAALTGFTNQELDELNSKLRPDVIYSRPLFFSFIKEKTKTYFEQ